MHKNPKAVIHPERSKLTTRWLTGKRFRYPTVGTTVPHIRANRRKTGFMPRFETQATGEGCAAEPSFLERAKTRWCVQHGKDNS